MKVPVFILGILLMISTVNYAQDEPTIAQREESLYLQFEFMKVDNSQEPAYQETEDFWEKIHQKRIENGQIEGWDLWSLLPGGEDQGYQYLVVTVFKDPLSMMQSGQGLWESAQQAYPDMSEDEIGERMNSAGESRDLAVRLYLHVIKGTKDEFKLEPGMVAAFDLMKAEDGMYDSYVNAELNTFLPLHQEMVDAGNKGHWQLAEIVLPQGSDVYASHITVNMFKDMEQFLNQNSEETEGMIDWSQESIQEGLNTRDLKWTYLGTLQRMVRRK